MQFTNSQLECLFKSKKIDFAKKIVWLKRNNQNVLVIGEYHVASSCENATKDDNEENDTCNPTMTHIIKAIIRWVKSKRCKLLLEIHPFLVGNAKEATEDDDSLTILHRELGYENIIGFDTRKDFFPSMELVDELMKMYTFYEYMKNPEMEVFRKVLLEWVIEPFLIPNTPLDLYVTYVQNKDKKMIRQEDKEIWKEEIEYFISKRHAFSIDKADTATIKEIFKEHQKSGQELVDYIAISHILMQDKDDFVIFGGLNHVKYQVKLLKRFGFEVKKEKEGILAKVNCI